MTWTTNIPLPTDALSASQGDLLNNNQALAAYYAQDHYMFDDANVAERGRHKAVHFASVAAPTTNANEIAMYNNSGVLTSVAPNNGFASTPLLIQAWAIIKITNANPPTIMQSYNVSSLTIPGNGSILVNFTNNLPSSLYGAVFGGSLPTLGTNVTGPLVPSLWAPSGSKSTTQCSIAVAQSSGLGLWSTFTTNSGSYQNCLCTFVFFGG